MFCPICRSEYKLGYTICKGCNVELVPKLPPEPELEYVEYEEILATHSPSDRAIIKSILDAEGVTYLFQGEYATTYLFHAIPVRLLVRKDQVEKAVEVLKDLNLSFTLGGSNGLSNDKDEDE
jgi:hypothetical protein